MPGYNRRGPRGEGPMTGRGMGYCNSDRKKEETIEEKPSVPFRPIRQRDRLRISDDETSEDRGLGLRLGRGRGFRGRGRGRGRW